MITLTNKELNMFKAFIKEGKDAIGTDDIQDVLEDNMTWCNSKDLELYNLGNSHVISGTMSSLETKGIICNSEESPRGAIQPDWFVTDKGLELAIELKL